MERRICKITNTFFLIYSGIMTYTITVEDFYIEHIDETDYPTTVFSFTGEVIIVTDTSDIVYYGVSDFGSGTNSIVVPKKGKLYKNQTLVYEGRFTDKGSYTGKCILYHYNGNKQYEGGMLNNRYSGFGTTYDTDGELVYEGGWVNGLQYGEGTLYENNVLIYTGYWFEGAKNGKGTDYSSIYRIYDGEWKDNMWHGSGTHYCEDGTIVQTTWNRGQKNGIGSVELPTGHYFINCEWKSDILLSQGLEAIPMNKLRKTRNRYTVIV